MRPKVPGLKSGWRLEAGVKGGDSLSGSSRVEERSMFGGGDLDLGRGVLLSSWMIE